mmetsp:Transcript_34713/g.6252  ORF Transcript_34713/g.6252 Transcript_34713/m.6252 type:complete len:85 (+) Transcript_34713:76-330(+)
MGRTKSRDEMVFHFKSLYNNKHSFPEILSWRENGRIVTIENNGNLTENIPIYIPPRAPYEKTLKHPLSDINGYMPYRIDFDYEY